jgi:putative ABC transport system ATP-binding protein
MVILSATKLVKKYGVSEAQITVIDNISLDINQGEFLAICGESGSGKSTLLYLLSGLEQPDRGQVTFLSQDLAKISDKTSALLRRREIAFVYQFHNLINNLSIFDNIVLPKKIDGTFSRSEKLFLDELIDVAGIRDILNKLPSQVSGGERQRAAIVRALFIRPKIIFLDEPTGSLDSTNAIKIMELLASINSNYNTAIVMVTHSAKLALYAKKIIKIKDGQINDA